MSYDNYSGGYADRCRTGIEYADEEMYVYDQCCENCRYYCGWGEKRDRGCKLYSRDEYERFPKTHWCYQWKGERRQQSRRSRYGDDDKVNNVYNDYRGEDYFDDYYSKGYGDCL